MRLLFGITWLGLAPALAQQPNGGTEKLFFYHHDHLGSTTYVTDENGDVVQHIEYLPSGEVFIEECDTTNAYATPYKFNGKELDEETGLYYYGARYLHPKYAMWLSTDPLEGTYPNVSSYCYTLGNPIYFLDPNGKRPTGNEAALMAKHVYKDKEAKQIEKELNAAGWYVSDISTAVRKDLNHTGFFECGLQMEIYQKDNENGTEYVMAFAGTNSITDFIHDITQEIGLSSQYIHAFKNAQTFSDELGSLVELTFVGHSLGGGEAAGASMLTGRCAITFNRASISDPTKIINRLNISSEIIDYQTVGKESIIPNVWMGGDPVSNILNNIGIGAKGKKVYIPIGIKSPLNSHSINEFLKYDLPDVQ